MSWHLMRRNNGESVHLDYAEWMLDSDNDVSNGTEPQTSGSIGSIAYTAGFAKMWQKDGAGNWVKIGGSDYD